MTTYDLIICTTGIVGPGGVLHDMPCDGLKVEQIVALRQRGHVLDPLLALNLGRILDLLVPFHGVHVDLSQVFGLVQILVERVRGVDRLELLRGVFPGILQNDLLAARVFCSS